MNFSVTNSANRSVEEMAKLLNTGFSGYFVPVNMNAENFADFARAYQIDLARSIVANGPEAAPGGLGILGIRGKRGWVGGFGVASDFRGMGLSRQLMDCLIEEARRNELSSLQLEVLSPNERARKLYQSGGFKVQRELVIYEAPAVAVEEAVPGATLVESRELEPGIALAAMGMPEQNRDFPPCWQRETPSILGQRGARAIIGRLTSGERGVLIFLSAPARRRGSVLHVGFDLATSEEARLTLLSALLNIVAAEYGPAEAENAPATSFNILNEPEGSSLSGLLQKVGFKENWRQFEMLLELQESGS